MPNPGSEALHKSLDLSKPGLYKNVGYKFEKWHDVSWWQLALRPPVRHFW